MEHSGLKKDAGKIADKKTRFAPAGTCFCFDRLLLA